MYSYWAKRKMAAYVDGELGPVERWMVRQGLLRQPELFDAYENQESSESLSALMRQLRDTPAPPANFDTRLKLAVSRESQPSWWTRSKLHLRNLLEPLAVPATGGILAAVLSIWIVVASVGMTPMMFAEDVPLSFFAKTFIATPQMMETSPFSVTEEAVVLAFIDGEGAVYDFRVLVGQDQAAASPRLTAEVASALVTSRFEPAMSFGRPVPGTMLITLRPTYRVEVRG